MSDLDPRHAFHALTVARVIDETADARSFEFDVPPALRALFGYEAGQFLTFEVPWQGRTLHRSYSLASAPGVDREHRVTVKRVTDGRASNWFNDRVRPGDTLRVQPPAGRFTLRDRATPLVLFAGGSGITPVISLAKAALHGTARRVRLVYANRDPRSVIFLRELSELALEHDTRFTLVHHLDSKRGFLDEAMLLDLAGDLGVADAYVCGPGPFMDVVEGALRGAGVPRERFFIERFVSPPDPVEGPVPSAAPAATAGAAEVPEQVTFHWQKRVHLVPYQAGETLLAAAKRAGIDPPYSCEDAYCSSCIGRLVRGEVRLLKNDCLTDQDLKDRQTLACQAIPITKDVELSWD